MKGLLLKYMKSHWNIDDFGRGKSDKAKARHKRKIKKQAKLRFKKDTEC